MKSTSWVIAGLSSVLLAGTAGAATLDDVRAKGELTCIVNTGLAGFAAPNDQGVWSGFDIDYCRAVAAAVLGDSRKVGFVPSTTAERFTKLRAGEGEILSRNTTWTFSRDVDLQQTFVGVNYYDGQGFMVPASLGVTSATQLDGASVCIQTGTTTELNLAEYFSLNKMKYEPVPIATNAEAQSNYLAGRCDVYTTDASGLAATKVAFDNPNDHVVLPEVVSKEPLGPVVRHGDDQWADIASWTLKAMMVAEELGITSQNAEKMKNSENPEIRRLLGVDELQGVSALGLSPDWAYNIITQVGNYGESFERHLGKSTKLGLSRGINALAKDGGLHYVPPVK
ncbi:MAG: amino acid ABC transporter substrate-binding protein [Proteobacteria bacterium]|nr:amino acid ABC transporter substrate-binding protein [Pseudomonadota bacterium]